MRNFGLFPLPNFRKGFQTEEKIIVGEQDIKLVLIDSFPNHPYHVFDDTDMSELVASIKANGLLSPIIVRNTYSL